MSRYESGFTLIELIVVISIVAITISLATPSWEQVSHKRKLTNATEQVAALLVIAQSEAQKRNQAVSLAFSRNGNEDWCVGAVLNPDGCDCTVTDSGSDQYCTIDGTSRRIEASEFPSLKLISAADSQPGSGDSRITFDPVRGILQPAGDRLQFVFESGRGHYRLQLVIGPTGLLTICNPDADKAVGGYAMCAT